MSKKKRGASATPATQQLTAAGVDFEERAYEHDPRAESYGLEAAQELGVEARSVFKTLVVELDHDGFGVCVVPVEMRADLKAAAAALGAKKAKLAQPADVQRLTGYVLGGVSPLGQRTTLPTVVDESAADLERVYVSGGRRGLDVGLAPQDLTRLTGAVLAPVAAPLRHG